MGRKEVSRIYYEKRMSNMNDDEKTEFKNKQKEAMTKYKNKLTDEDKNMRKIKQIEYNQTYQLKHKSQPKPVSKLMETIKQENPLINDKKELRKIYLRQYQKIKYNENKTLIS